MFKLSMRSLLSHKLRMLMSVAAVVLGVAFVSGTQVFGNSLSTALDDVATGSATDLYVAPTPPEGLGRTFGSDLALPATAVQQVAAVDGVQRAVGAVSVAGMYALGTDGKVVGNVQSPGTALAWTGSGATRAVGEGAPPSGPQDVVLDTATARAADVGVGDTVTLLTPAGERRQARVSGTWTPPGSGLGGSASFAFAPAVAQQFLTTPGTWSAVEVTLAPGTDDAAAKQRVLTALGAGTVEVSTRAEQAQEVKDQTSGFTSIFNNILLGFAVVAILVGGFLIFNTFSMIVAQRARETALLRAVGARRRQVTRALLLEALVVGLIGSLVGLVLGIGVAVALGSLLGTIGLSVAITPALPVSAVVLSLVLGIGITVLAAYLPLRRAGRIPPVAALRDSVSVPEGPSRRRLVVGLVLLALAAGGFAAGLNQTETGARSLWSAAGGVLLIVATIALAPALAAGLTRVVGRLLPGSGGTPGVLARANTVRNPRRTAATASALTVGLALVTGITVIAGSINASIDAVVDRGVRADLTLTSAGFLGFETKEADAVAAVDGVASVLASRSASALLAGREGSLSAYGGGSLASALDATPITGRVDTVARGAAITDRDTARERGWEVGDRIEVTYANGRGGTTTLQGIYAPNVLLGGGLLVNLDDYRTATGDTRLDAAYLTLEQGRDAAGVKQAAERAVAANPTLLVQDREAIKAQSAAQTGQLLAIVYGLLALSIIIAVLGVVNTMGMSVLERTREIGLLRAVGLTRRQSRRMIRGESVLIAVIGGLLGVAAGIVVGVAMQRALSTTPFVNVLAVPYVQIAAFLVGAAVVGVLAAVAPARRASRMDVLGAISTS